jgi:hypothetical protein
MNGRQPLDLFVSDFCEVEFDVCRHTPGQKPQTHLSDVGTMPSGIANKVNAPARSSFIAPGQQSVRNLCGSVLETPSRHNCRLLISIDDEFHA